MTDDIRARIERVPILTTSLRVAIERAKRDKDLVVILTAQAESVAASLTQLAADCEGQMARAERAEFAASEAMGIVEGLQKSLLDTIQERDRERQRAEEAERKCESLSERVDAFKAASMLDVGGDPEGVTPALLEKYVAALQAQVEEAERRLREAMATVQKTSAGPRLFVAGVQICSWFGCAHDSEADTIAAQINAVLSGQPLPLPPKGDA